MPVDGWPLYKLGIIDKEIACIYTSKNDLVKLMGMTSYLVVMTLLTCRNELVSCGNDLLICGNELVSCGNDYANLWERVSNLW